MVIQCLFANTAILCYISSFAIGGNIGLYLLCLVRHVKLYDCQGHWFRYRFRILWRPSFRMDNGLLEPQSSKLEGPFGYAKVCLDPSLDIVSPC